MGKNRIKNLRNITVNDKMYKWSISNHNYDGDGGCIYQIWNDTKELIYKELTHEIITPKIVRETILKIHE